MSGPDDLDTVDEPLVGPSGRLDRPRSGRFVQAGRRARLLWAAVAVIVAVTVGPGLLSGPVQTPEDPPRGGTPSRVDGRAGTWTGGPERPSGNRFVQSPVRLLRLPA